ncbi:MAG TPA: beta-ketoacyl-[acyl-carrier-protein] synthase family protein [Pseudobdellovibrionaceae bacterium]|jgi:3-oxoacyl-[acyl-carrier-protein] synthase II
MKKADVVITAYGLVSPLGSTIEDFESGLFSGKSGVKSIRGSTPDSMVAEDFPVPYAATIDRKTLPQTKYFGPQEAPPLMKSWLMTAVATESILAKLDPQHPVDAIVYGTADGVSFEQVAEVLKHKKQQDFDEADYESQYDFMRTRCESSVEVIHNILKDSGFAEIPGERRICINSACATGNNALGIAFEAIQAGRWERCIVGGVDARCEPSNFLNFYYLGALTTDNVAPEKASRPFSVDRSGFVRGEGAAVLMVESYESAVARGAQILCRVVGYGFTSDAFRLTDGRDDGSSVMKAMELAIQSAGLTPHDIDYINAHGTSTPLNDRLESLAIKKVFGEKAYKTPISSLKSQIGHSTIASSALEAIACALMLQNQKVAPTLNFHGGDPDCDLDYVPEGSREIPLTHVLSNSFGFGGQNSCIVFAKGNK